MRLSSRLEAPQGVPFQALMEEQQPEDTRTGARRPWAGQDQRRSGTGHRALSRGAEEGAGWEAPEGAGEAWPPSQEGPCCGPSACLRCPVPLKEQP